MITKISILIFFLFQITYSQNSNGYLSTTKNNLDSSGYNQYNPSDTVIAAPNSLNNAFEEVFLSFNYYGIVNRTLTVNYNGIFFLPIGEMFDQLLINYTIDRQKDVIRGFYIYQENKYEINFRDLTFKSPDNEFSFSIGDFVKKDFEYYLTADLFYKAFRLSFSVDISNLTLNLAAADILPVYSNYLREQKYSYSSKSKESEKFPLLFPREKSFLSGGFIDYTLSGSYSKHYLPFYNYDFGIGAELFWGDLQTSVNGYSISNASINSEIEYRWRYVLDKNQFMSQVSLGNLISTGINSYTFHGLQISNQPLEQRETFVKYLISEQTAPGSTIELYINNQLIDHTTTDAAGNFHFLIPLTYGSSFVKLKYYGSNGETQIVDRYYQIPYNLNPPEEFNYTVDFGIIKNTNKNYIHASGIYGINDWLSNLIGAEYLEDNLFDEPLFFNSLTARISSSYLFNIFTAPKAFYRISANAIYPSLTSINLSYTRYESNPLYNPTNINNEISSSLNLPVYMDENPLNIQVNGDYQDFSSSKIYGFRVSSSKNIGSFTPTLVYSLRQFKYPGSLLRQSYLSTGAIYSIGTLPSPISFLRGLLINSGINYNFNSEKFESYFVSFASNLTNSVRLQFDYEKNLTYDVTNARMQLFLELPFTRSYSTIGKDFFTTNMQGSLLFNDSQAQINFFNREQIGRAASSFRTFIDENANGVYDNGEQPITDAKINIASLNSNIRLGDGETQVNDLNPFSIYNVKIDETNLENPMYTAKDKIFSFEAGPNYVKNINIPFYSASEIGGNVQRISGSVKSPLSGIKVHIEGIDYDQNLTVNTFSDGSFYYFGLRPGKFKIYLNKNQLEYINCVSEPAEIILEIEASGAGKSFENLNFELRSK